MAHEKLMVDPSVAASTNALPHVLKQCCSFKQSQEHLLRFNCCVALNFAGS